MEKVVLTVSYSGVLIPFPTRNRESSLESVFSLHIRTDGLLLHTFWKQDEQEQEQQILTFFFLLQLWNSKPN